MVCLDPHYCQAAVDMSKDDFPTQVNMKKSRWKKALTKDLCSWRGYYIFCNKTVLRLGNFFIPLTEENLCRRSTISLLFKA